MSTSEAHGSQQARAAGRRDSASSGMPQELDAHRLIRRGVWLALLIVLVGGAVVALPGLDSLRRLFARADAALVVLVGLLKLCSCLSNVVAFRDVFCPRLGWRFSYQLSLAEQATNVLIPTGGAGGLALGAWALREGGMSTEHIARRSVAFFVLTSIPNFACAAILGPLLLAGMFPGQAPVIPTAVFSGLAWTTAAIIVALPFWTARIEADMSSGRLRHKLRNAAVMIGNGIRDTGQLLRDRRWRAILGAAGYLGFDIAAFVVAFAAFRGPPPLAPLVFGYVIGQLGGLIPLPAGIGGTDGGLIGASVLYGASVAQSTAAVLTYRAFQVGVPAILGTVAFVRLRSMLTRSDSPAQVCAALAEEPSAVKLQGAV